MTEILKKTLFYKKSLLLITLIKHQLINLAYTYVQEKEDLSL